MIAIDLSKRGASAGLVSQLLERSVIVDALVNNAGFSTYGEFWRDDPATQSDMLAVNVVALTELSRLILPGMVERGRGRILNLGSVGSFSAAPMTAAYAATKAYVLSLSLAMADELRGSGGHGDVPVSRPDRDRVPGSSRDARLRSHPGQEAPRRPRGRRGGIRGDEGRHAVRGDGRDAASCSRSVPASCRAR